MDEKPSIGTNYYRVKQVDFDRKYDYSSIASIRFEDDESKIFPNPVNDELFVISHQAQTAQIFNQLGKLIWSGNLVEGHNLVNLSAFSDGIYYLKMREEVVRLVKK